MQSNNQKKKKKIWKNTSTSNFAYSFSPIDIKKSEGWYLKPKCKNSSKQQMNYYLKHFKFITFYLAIHSISDPTMSRNTITKILKEKDIKTEKIVKYTIIYKEGI